MNADTLIQIGKRRAELKRHYSVNSGLSFEENLIEKLIEAENEITILRERLAAWEQIADDFAS